MKFDKVVGLAVSLAIGIPSVSMAGSSLCNEYQSDFFGPNVCVFDAKTSPSGDIQNIVNAIHDSIGHDKDSEEKNQFASKGYALLFKPGNYSSVTVPVGFYTQVLGLGLTPDETTIKTLSVWNTDLYRGTSLDNFWRGAENLATTDETLWGVSQASPLRNIHIKSGLLLALGGDAYASGGFLANTQVDNTIEARGQQQWITRNSTMGAWTGAVWNMVFVGTPKAPTGALPNTNVDNTPRIQEKPYLTYDQGSQQYEVVVPNFIGTPTSGPNWKNGYTLIPQSQIIVATPGMTADQINKKLTDPKVQSAPAALIFTPGQYDLNSTIVINKPNTVVLGLGVPALTATKAHTPIMTTSGSGIKIGGILFEAGSNDPLNPSDPSLLQVGTSGNDTGSASSPSSLSDVYCRVGGRTAAQTNSCVTIYDSYTIGDNLWLWRADHGAGAGSWISDQANHGLIIKGNNVTMYGLAVEHFNQEQVQWFGENGSLYFYQSELPYDVPAKTIVPASFNVEANVNKFAGYGLGVYDYFRQDTGAYAISAISAPNHPGISFTHMVSTKLGNNPSYGPLHIEHMLQTTDGQVFGPSSASGYVKYDAWPELKQAK
jgi:hypothetical protein